MTNYKNVDKGVDEGQEHHPNLSMLTKELAKLQVMDVSKLEL